MNTLLLFRKRSPLAEDGSASAIVEEQPWPARRWRKWGVALGAVHFITFFAQVRNDQVGYGGLIFNDWNIRSTQIQDSI